MAAARRVIGYGGAFPPYKGLVNKFEQAAQDHDSFDAAFRLRDHPAGRRKRTDYATTSDNIGDGFELQEFAWDLIHMGKDHEFPVPTPGPRANENAVAAAPATGHVTVPLTLRSPSDQSSASGTDRSHRPGRRQTGAPEEDER